MSEPKRSIFSRVLHVVDTMRLVIVNLLFLALFIWLLALLLRGYDTQALPDHFVLHLNPTGVVVEDYTGSPMDHIVSSVSGASVDPEIRLRDMLQVIDQAGADKRVLAISLDLKDFWWAGPAQLEELGAALNRYKRSEKPLIAFGAVYDQNSYYLAAHADEVLLIEGGAVLLEGFASYQNYFAEALASLNIDVHVFQAGTYKAAVEPFMRNDMSPEAKEANQALIDSLWHDFGHNIAAARDLEPEQLDEYINTLTDNIIEARGSGSLAALNYQLVTQLSNPMHVECWINASVVSAAEVARSECNALLDEGADYKDLKRIQRKIAHMPRIELQDYFIDLQMNAELSTKASNHVGVIVASGVIVDGVQPTGTIGSDSIIALIQQARDDKDIKAVVIRIDSPGGDALASDDIWVAIAELDAVKPVVISMGNVAASGGYWMALGGSEIFAQKTTITGSIGVFGMIPTFEKTLNELGVYTDGVGTHAISGAIAADRDLDPKVAMAINASVHRTYQTFIELVAAERGMTLEQADAVAQGRVWTGTQAYENGLIDTLGGLHDAIGSAAEWADLDDYAVTYIEPDLGFYGQVLDSMADFTAQADDSGILPLNLQNTALLPNQWLALRQQLAKHPNLQQALLLLQSQRSLVSHCMCALPINSPLYQ